MRNLWGLHRMGRNSDSARIPWGQRRRWAVVVFSTSDLPTHSRFPHSARCFEHVNFNEPSQMLKLVFAVTRPWASWVVGCCWILDHTKMLLVSLLFCSMARFFFRGSWRPAGASATASTISRASLCASFSVGWCHGGANAGRWWNFLQMDDERARETAVFLTKDMSFLVLSFHILSFLGHVNAIIYRCVCVCFFFLNRRSSGFPKCFPHFHAGFGIPPLRRGAAWIRPMDLIPARRRSGKIVGR